MHSRTIAYALIAAISMAVSALAQTYPPNGGYPQPSGQNVQPVQPQLPTLVPRGAQPGVQQPVRRTPPAPPFTLTPQQQAQVNQVLGLWEQRNSKVKTFDTRFKRWIYDTVFGRPDQPKFVDLGVIKYASPDKGMFRVDTTEKNGREVPIEEARAEDWKSDGKSIIEYNHVKKTMTVHKLPPELQGKAIADGPLPFLFGSTADSLKRRYFIHTIPTPPDAPGQVWLEVFPRFQQDAANFCLAQLIITDKMEPYALHLIQPNRKDKVVYQFYETVINDPMRLFKGDPFRASKPFGWQSIVEETPTTQARHPANAGRR